MTPSDQDLIVELGAGKFEPFAVADDSIERLVNGLQGQMGDLEVETVQRNRSDDTLVVLDGGCARSPSGASPRWVSEGPQGGRRAPAKTRAPLEAILAQDIQMADPPAAQPRRSSPTNRQSN